MNTQRSKLTYTEFLDYLKEWDKPVNLTKLGLEFSRKVTSSRYGVVVRAVDRTHDWDDAYTFSIGSTAAESKFTLGTTTNKYNGGGWIDETQTYLAAVGETIERYCGAYPHFDLQRQASYRELINDGFQAIDPNDISLFDPTQFEDSRFEFREFNEDSVIHWVRGFDLTNSTEIYYPAALLLLTNFAEVEGKPIGYSTSSGLASHSTPLDAIISGLYEQAERDAFCIAWYGGLTFPRIDPYSDKELRCFWKDFIEPSGIDVELIDVSKVNEIPTVVAVSVNRTTDVAPIAFGASSAASLLDACKSASVESLQTRNWVKANQRDGISNINLTDDLYETIKDFEDHIMFYIPREAADKARFFYEGELQPLNNAHDLKKSNSKIIQLKELIEKARQQNGRVLTFDLTTPDISQVGGHVFKTIIHGFQQLDCGYGRRFLGGSRLRNRPVEMGFKNTELTITDFNQWPHPFP